MIPVYEEELRVGKREIGRGSVRVRSYIVETPVQEEVRLHDERVEVERRPVDRVVNDRELRASPLQERTVEVTARGEEPVMTRKCASRKRSRCARKTRTERKQSRTRFVIRKCKWTTIGPALEPLLAPPVRANNPDAPAILRMTRRGGQ